MRGLSCKNIFPICHSANGKRARDLMYRIEASCHGEVLMRTIKLFPFDHRIDLFLSLLSFALRPLDGEKNAA